MQNQLAYLPSPTVSVLHLGPLPIHYYALCIVVGILVAIYLSDRRWKQRGGLDQQIGEVAGWTVVFGIIGGRIYHVITDPELYFVSGRRPVDALKIWDGGLGIWGAVAFGALGAYIGCRRHGMNFAAFADVVAPGIVLAQGIGRLGNWFNNELYGRATSLPWRLQIHDVDVVQGSVARDSHGHAVVLGYFQPTFLYELIWDLAVGTVLVLLDRKLRLGRGNVFALYVVGYTAGRGWIEALRSDHANHILGLRVNDWASILVFAGGAVWFITHRNQPRSSAAAAGTPPLDSGPTEPGPIDSGPTESGPTGSGPIDAPPPDSPPAGPTQETPSVA